jgi:tetratricopeptide (TPR) repeat protein
MNKKTTYIALVLFFLIATAFVVARYKMRSDDTASKLYPLKERKGALAQSADWKATKEKSDKLIRIVRLKPDDKKSALALASLYIQEGRNTGDHVYYNEAALKYVNDVLTVEPENFEALILKSLVELSQHHFVEGLQTAEKAKMINPYNSYVYGLVVDGNVEMGNYSVAIENLEKMVSIRPDLRSYSRISYMREIHGQMSGAIDAMKMAVDAGFPGEEGTEWARVQLGYLYEKTGDLKSAEMNYIIALQERPDYPYAIAGMANIAVAKKDYNNAIEQYKKADILTADYSFKEKLAEVYLLTGQQAKAKEMLGIIREELNNAASEEKGGINHHIDKELAFIYLMENNPSEALKHAIAEYNRRPDNVEVAEMVAWAHFRNGEAQKALHFLHTALKTGSKNPTLLSHAAMIYAQVGDKAKAKVMLEEVVKIDPNIEPTLKKESQALLSKL